MKIKTAGTVSKNEVGVGGGHSQVRCPVTVDVGDGVKRQAELILSTPDLEILDAFPRGAEMELEGEITVVKQSTPMNPALPPVTAPIASK